MAKELFIERSFKPATLEIITQADAIIAEYQGMGFSLTLRQLYYQFVARDIIPNCQSEYKRLGSIVNDARLAGMLDWDAIEDRTRNVRKSPAWGSPRDIMEAVASQYKENPWDGQQYAPEVWIEKDALVGVIEPICTRMRVPYFACRGYASQSEVYSAGKRFASSRRQRKTPIVFHLGDHDPSGLDMTRDNAERLSMFAGMDVEVRRLALNMDQVEEYSPPPNPAKDTDARFSGYEEIYGGESWELDALNPPVIEALISDALGSVIDQAAWDDAMSEESKNRQNLHLVADNWEEVSDYVEDQFGEEER